MKKFRLFLIVIILISVSSSFQRVAAQEKSKAELEKEQKLKLEIDQQKKVMADQKKAQTEAEAVAEDQIKNFQVQIESGDKGEEKVFRYMPRGNRSPIFDESFSYSVPDMQAFYGHSMSGNSERTTWDFSKTVKDNTFSKEYSFEVEKSVKSVVMSVMGDCKSGEIRIKIVMPNGKNYSDILIDESGNLNWRKSFTISETENQDKTGDWKFQISSTKATGYFRISLQSF
jgi:hypothetical protein